MRSIIFIHGANASQKSFAYLEKHITERYPETRFYYFNYSSKNSFYYNLEQMRVRLLTITGSVTVLAHSLGGVYALHLYNHLPEKICKVVSFCTPFGGVLGASFMRWAFPFNQLLQDIGVESGPIACGHYITISIPWIQFVATKGNLPWISPLLSNDGVVTHLSMTVRKDIKYKYVDTTHYEILSDLNVVQRVLRELSN